MSSLQDFLVRILAARYADGGRSYEAVDCYGIVWLYWRDVEGRVLPSWDERYTTAASASAARCFVLGIADHNRVEIPRVGDTVVFFNKHYHCGLVLDETHFLHCDRGINPRVELIDRVNLGGKREGFYRPKCPT